MNTIDLTSNELLETLFKAFSHHARIAILEELRSGEHCVCHFEAALGFRQAYISQQLAVLREIGLITDRRDGWNVYYRVTDKKVFDMLDLACKLTGRQPQPRAEAHYCPCPHCNQNKEREMKDGNYKSTGVGLREL